MIRSLAATVSIKTSQNYYVSQRPKIRRPIGIPSVEVMLMLISRLNNIIVLFLEYNHGGCIKEGMESPIIPVNATKSQGLDYTVGIVPKLIIAQPNTMIRTFLKPPQVIIPRLPRSIPTAKTASFTLSRQAPRHRTMSYLQ